jgi:MscS family membrane protein
MTILAYKLLDNHISSLLTVLTVILIFLLFKKWFAHNLFSILFNRVNKKWKAIDRTVFHKLVILPLSSFITALVALLAMSSLVFPNAWKISLNEIQLHEAIQNLGRSVVIVYLILFAAKFVEFFSLVLEMNINNNKDKRDDQLIVFFRDFLKVIIYIIGLMLVLKIAFHVNVGAILTGLSIVGAALALAAKESIENLIASFIIFFDKPFYTGDIVKVNNQQNTAGTIESIGLRSTRIRTNDQTLITVPNKQMVDSVVDNWSMRTSRRAEISLQLDLSNSNAAIQQLTENLKNTFSQNPLLLNQQIFIAEFSHNSITLFIEYFTPNIKQEAFQQIKQDISLKLKEMIEVTGVKLAAHSNNITIVSKDSQNSQAKTEII